MRRLPVLSLVVLAGCASAGYSRCGRCCRTSLVERAVGGLVAAVADELTREEPKPPPMTPLLKKRSHPGRISTRAMFVGGHVQLIGVPATSREEVVLAFRPVAPLDEECDVRIFRDGLPLTVGERVRHTKHELLATLRIDELGASAQLTGLACGHAFDIDAVGRDAIANFVARFHRSVDQLSASSSTSIAQAR
jgi:hypothetical protein